MNVLFNVGLPSLILGFLLAQLYFQRKLIHRWRMTSRREWVLLQTVHGLGEKMAEGTRDEAMHHYGAGMIALLDELHNQQRHMDDFWPRVPKAGEPWLDFEPAPLLSREPGEG